LFIANLLLSVMVKEFWRSVRIRQSYGKKSSGTFFFRTRCRLNCVVTCTLQKQHCNEPLNTEFCFNM